MQMLFLSSCKQLCIIFSRNVSETDDTQRHMGLILDFFFIYLFTFPRKTATPESGIKNENLEMPIIKTFIV